MRLVIRAWLGPATRLPNRRASKNLVKRQAAKHAAADIEGYSATAKFGQPGRLNTRKTGPGYAKSADWRSATPNTFPSPLSAGGTLGIC